MIGSDTPVPRGRTAFSDAVRETYEADTSKYISTSPVDGRTFTEQSNSVPQPATT